MKMMEEVFFSFTAGGEALSLAAAQAVIQKIRREPVVETLAAQGEKILGGVRALIDKHGVGDFVDITGRPAWSFLVISGAGGYTPLDLKTLWMQEIIDRGILSLGTHNMSYSHTDVDIKRLLDAYDEVFPVLRDAVDNGALPQLLRCEPLVPVFKVR